MVNIRGVFRAQSNINDGAFLPKYLTAFYRKLFSQKSFIIDLRLGSKYAYSEFNTLNTISFFLHFSKVKLMTFQFFFND